jgi:hypothetical protein
MAYQTGSATSPSGLLDTVRAFLSLQGWTINYWGGDNMTVANPSYNQYLATKVLCVTSPVGTYHQFMCHDDVGYLYTSGATGYNSGANRNSQPGHSSRGYSNQYNRQDTGWACTNGLQGPYAAYHLFVSDSYCHIVVEVSTNRFAHLHAGQLEKAGNYTGGEYYTNTWWCYGDTSSQHVPDSAYNTMPFDGMSAYGNHECAVRFDADGAVNNWRTFYANGGNNSAQGFMRGQSMVRPLTDKLFNTMNGMAIFLPSLIFGPRPLGGCSIYGTVKDVRPVNVFSITPKQIITIGADQWIVFPIIRKGSGTQYEAVSGNYGIAYRMVP